MPPIISDSAIIHSQDTLTIVTPKKQEQQFTKMRKNPQNIPATLVRIDSVVSKTHDITAPDSSGIRRFYLLQSFANDLRTPSTVIERPPKHPDSLVWEDIAGIPQAPDETPEWIKVLGTARSVAGIIAVIYLLFFTN